MSAGARADERYGSAPAEAPPLTRAWLMTPDAASAGPKRRCMTLLSQNHISRLALHVRKVDRATRQMRVVAQVPHGLSARLDAYALLIARECPAWTVVAAEPTADECAHFSGRQIVQTPPELVGGPASSGAAGEQLSVISSSVTSASSVVREREAVARAARAEEERAEAVARAERAEAAAQVLAARVAQLEEALRSAQL